MSLASDFKLKGAWNEALIETSDKMQDFLFNYLVFFLSLLKGKFGIRSVVT